jgi:hypothetical protein
MPGPGISVLFLRMLVMHASAADRNLIKCRGWARCSQTQDPCVVCTANWSIFGE